MNMRTLLHPAILILLTRPVAAQCPGGTEVTLYTSDFEANDGGLVVGGGMDWQWGTVQTLLLDTADCSGLFEHPPGANSGTKAWGNDLDGCYSPLGLESTLTLTVDLSPPAYASAELDWHQWFNVFVDFDYMTIYANGTPIYSNDTTQDSFTWQARSVDLSPFLGDASVDISFALFATTVVNLAGWYVDDLSVTACVVNPSGIGNASGVSAALWHAVEDGALHLRAQELPAGSRVDVRDALGRMARSFPVDGDALLSLNGLRTGSYTATLVGADGALLRHVRLMLP